MLPDEDVEDDFSSDEVTNGFYAATDPPPRPRPERRRGVARYIASAVVVAGVLGIAAGMRLTAAQSEPGARASRRWLTPAQTAPLQTVGPSAAQVAAAVAPTVAPATSSSAGAPHTDKSAAPTEADAQAANEAKQASQRALERGNVALSVETGERSVELDSSDAEAWLILGAAYLQRGSAAEAHRCFASCVQLATRGPRRECAALRR